MPAPAGTPEVVVLKDEPGALVVRVSDGTDHVVRKHYRNAGLRRLQTFLRRSRARREHDNLLWIHSSGIPCLEPLRWHERRTLGCVQQSVLETRWLPSTRPAKAVLAELAPSQTRARHGLIAGMARLLAALHRKGFLWCTPMPRNFLVQGDPGDGQVVVCDVPAAVVHRRSIHGSRTALLDLFDAAFSPSRRRDFSAGERLRWLLAYCNGDRRQVRSLWAALARRSRTGNRTRKNLHMALWTYLLGPFRRRATS